MILGKLCSGLCVVALSATLAAPAWADPAAASGYHVETRVRYGPLIGGAITTAAGGMMLATGIWQMNTPSAQGEGPGAGGELMLIPGIAALAVGLPLLAYGLFSRREVQVRDSVPALQAQFSIDQRHVAAGLTYAF